MSSPSRIVVVGLALLPCLAVPPARAAWEVSPPQRVADLVTDPAEGPSSPPSFVELGGYLYFSALDDAHGHELWRSDGTAAGTELVVDLCPGRCSSGASHLTRVGDRLFFIAGGATGRHGVWVTDGTAEGTRLAAHLPVHGFQNPIHDPVALGGAFYFNAPHPELGSELWVSDGTPEGTGVAVDVCPGSCSSYPGDLTVVGDVLFFKAGEESEDTELWRSDGTPEGTYRVADICPGTCSSLPFHLSAVAGRLFFNADDGVHGRELWVSDGTAAGTMLLEDFEPGPGGSTPSAFAGPGGRIYIETAGGPGDVRFWRTDGTPGGAREAFELLPYGFEEHPELLVSGPRRLYFTIDGARGEELRVLDAGDPASRRIAGPFDRIWPACCGQGVVGGRDGGLAFVVRQEGSEDLWVTDGTEAGTRRVLEARPTAGGRPGLLTPLGDRWLFVFDDGTHRREPWVTDGTRAGTMLVRNIHLPSASSNPQDLTSWRGQVFFNAGYEPFVQPTAESSWRIADPEAGAEGVDPEAWLLSPTAAADHLFFTERETGYPMALAEPAGAPVLLAETSFAGAYTPVGDRAFFATHPDGQRVWVSDGTPEGTRLLRDVDPEWSSRCDLSPCPPIPTYPRGLTAAGDRLFFVAASEATSGGGPELWTSDGTTDGTVRIPGAPPPEELAALGDRVVLLTAPGAPEPGVWLSDGTAAGTRRILSLGAGARPRDPVAADGRVYFLTTSGDGRTLLWRTDGTAGGTVTLLASETPYAPDPSEMTAFGSRLLFARFDAARGEELWISDGTAGGTGLLADLRPGPESSNPSALTALGDLVVFAADDGEVGHEPWASDGTAAGTFRLADVHPGPDPSSPGAFAAAGDWIVFDASDGETGREPWAVRVEDDGAGGGGGGAEPPPVPDAPPFTSADFPDFRFWVRITDGAGAELPVRRETACIPETLCISGSVPGRSELFLRIVGPKPNGYLWPTLVKFSTSRVEVWIEQVSSGQVQYYRLDPAERGEDRLPGLFDRRGFLPPGG